MSHLDHSAMNHGATTSGCMNAACNLSEKFNSYNLLSGCYMRGTARRIFTRSKAI